MGVSNLISYNNHIIIIHQANYRLTRQAREKVLLSDNYQLMNLTARF